SLSLSPIFSIFLLSVAVGFLAFADAIASAPYSALIPDVVPVSQYGAASGWMGVLTMIGNLLGGGGTGFIIAYLHIIGIYVSVTILMVITAIGVCWIVRSQAKAIEAHLLSRAEQQQQHHQQSSETQLSALSPSSEGTSE